MCRVVLLTVLPRDVAAHRGVGHLVGGGEGEHVRAARHAPRRRARAVADSELVKVQPDLEDVKRRYVILRYCRYCRYLVCRYCRYLVCRYLADVVRLPLDKVDAGAADLVGGGEATKYIYLW